MLVAPTTAALNPATKLTRSVVKPTAEFYEFADSPGTGISRVRAMALPAPAGRAQPGSERRRQTEITMHHHYPALTTHTAELSQIKEINAALVSDHRVTAASVDVPSIPGDAILRYLEPSGPPSYPYIHGHFSQLGATDTMRVELHTTQLRAISHQLLLGSHIWGVGSSFAPPYQRMPL